MTFLEKAQDTAKALGISERDALTLEFMAAEAWAQVAQKNKARAVMHIAADHSAGLINGPTMRQCLDATARGS